MPKLEKQYYLQNTEQIAQSLLGKILVRKLGNIIMSGMIVETEAYVGAHDQACHAARGRTERNQAMYEPGGIWYIYLIYGMYYNLNIVTEKTGQPTAVLIRAVEPIKGIGRMMKNRQTEDVFNLTSGPGKLCQALEIGKALNMSSAAARTAALYIDDQRINIPSRDIIKAKRIGVDYAGDWKNKLLRFYVKNNRFVSKLKKR